MKEHQIQISDESSAYIQAQLGRCGFASVSDYVESLVRENRLAQEHLVDVLAAQGNELERLAVEGHHSGQPITVDDEYWSKKRQALKERFDAASE